MWVFITEYLNTDHMNVMLKKIKLWLIHQSDSGCVKKQYGPAAKWKMYGLRHVYQLTVCKKASAQHGHRTGAAIRLLKLSTKWMQVVGYTLQPLGRKLGGSRGHLDAMGLCPCQESNRASCGNQSRALSVSHSKPLWLLQVIFKCVTFGQQQNH
jgi:hypothetical protein